MSEFLGRLFAMLAVWRLTRKRRSAGPETAQVQAVREQLEDVSERTVPRSRRAERLVVLLLMLAALFGFGFTAVYVLDGHNNQLLGLAMGGMFALLAAAAIVAGKLVVPQETSVEEREPLLEEGQPEEIVQLVESGGEGISRRGLLVSAGGVAGAAMTTAVATTLASLGPRLTDIHRTPWHRGIQFVDEDGKPYHADEIEIGSFYTALPAGYYWEQLGAPLLVVRLPAHFIHLPPSRAHWAPRGILAFSKICPHAACAISLYRYPTFAPTSPAEPAFTCPCHYSTFAPGEGGKLLFGPAGRALPQLPVMVDANGYLRAGGNFDEDVGPAWFDVHAAIDMSLVRRRLEQRAERLVRWNEERIGAARGIKWALRYVFPDHWSFMLGEVALYSFIVLVVTGIFLTLYYTPSDHQVTYAGVYGPLDGAHMSEAYRSVLNLSTVVPAGLLMRQTHHWAADVFIASIVLHLMRVFFTGAYRKPRDLNWMIGLTMLILAILEGFAGYSLIDDLLSGMGLAIAYAVAMSIPLIGGQFSTLAWDGNFPGSARFFPRLEILHVFLIPAVLAVLITLHLAMIMRQHHTQFPGRGRREGNVVGTPTWPAYALRSIGLMLVVVAVMLLLGGLIQINPIWQWGPYHVYLSENGAQPDWYIGWLIGALRLMPNFEPRIAGRTIIPNPFWGGAAFPMVVFAVLYAWPWLERRLTHDYRSHHLLERPRDRPLRTAAGAGFLSWVVIIFMIGSADRLFFRLDISYTAQIHFWEAGVWVAPVIVFLLTLWTCRWLQRSEAHPLRGWAGEEVPPVMVTEEEMHGPPPAG